MALRPYFAPLSNFESNFDDFFFGLPLTFRDSNHGIGIGSTRRNSLWNSFPETGIYFDEDESIYSVSIDLPGVKVSDITLKVEENGRMVYLSGCRKFRSPVNSDHRTKKQEVSESKFAKRFTIGENVDIEKLTANMSDGVLTLSAPKKAPRKGRAAREIKIFSKDPNPSSHF